MIIPNSPGGGYDQTGRAAVAVMEEDDITGGSFTIDNVIGAGGAGAMTSLVGRAGEEHTMMTVGLGVVGSTYSFAAPFSLGDATPLAQLMSEPEGTMAKYLLLKHYRGGPGGNPSISVPMDQWTPEEVSDHIGFMGHVVDTFQERGEFVDSQALSRRGPLSASAGRAGRRSPTARSPRPRT